MEVEQNIRISNFEPRTATHSNGNQVLGIFTARIGDLLTADGLLLLRFADGALTTFMPRHFSRTNDCYMALAFSQTMRKAVAREAFAYRGRLLGEAQKVEATAQSCAVEKPVAEPSATGKRFPVESVQLDKKPAAPVSGTPPRGLLRWGDARDVTSARR